MATHYDVLIVGAGLSGIGAAYHLQSRLPHKTYAILEARDALGGTWDLFRYPGIRSDSDMYTLGYSFRPWTNPKAIADGPAILAYVKETAEMYGITDHIRYRQRVVRAAWSTSTARWTVSTEDAEYTCDFLFACSGYYDYDAGYTPSFEGAERFEGRVVHPQHWTDDIDYAGKRVVVIGSGATAVTLVPELAKKAAHVTMLQRSPTYVVAMPARDAVADFLREHLSANTAYAMTRWKNVAFSLAFFNLCRLAPKLARRLIAKGVEKATSDKVDVGVHFNPRYEPWDQRMCIVPDGDLFDALVSGTAEVVTDTITRFTPKGLALASGKELEADIVVTATGLKLKFFGGADVFVDDVRFDMAKALTYRGLMLSDVPNMAFVVGYTNASWTLKADLTSEFVCRLIEHLDRYGHAWCCPKRTGNIEERPIIDFSSTYVQRALDDLPKQGTSLPWRLYQNYALDRMTLRHLPLADRALTFGGNRSRAMSARLRSTPHR